MLARNLSDTIRQSNWIACNVQFLKAAAVPYDRSIEAAQAGSERNGLLDICGFGPVHKAEHGKKTNEPREILACRRGGDRRRGCMCRNHISAFNMVS